MIKLYNNGQEVIIDQFYCVDMPDESRLCDAVNEALSKAGKSADMITNEGCTYSVELNGEGWWWLIADIDGSKVILLEGTLAKPFEFGESYVGLLNESSIGWDPDRYLAICYHRKDFINMIGHNIIDSESQLTEKIGPDLLRSILNSLK